MSIEIAKRFNLAFLGGGVDSAVGRVHQVATSMDLRFQLVAGCFSRHANINEATARAYGVAPEHAHGSLEELLEKEGDHLDAVVILTPTDQHTSHVLSCLEAGIPVISEKTLTTSSQEAQAIRDALLQRKGFLAVTYNYLGYPMLRELRAIISQGGLGKITQMHLEMPQEGFGRVQGDKDEPIVPQSWRLHDNTVPTVSLDLGAHLHSIAHFLTGERPREVSSVFNTFGNFKSIVDNVMCLAKYDSGVVSSLWYGKVAMGCRNGLRVRVYGTRGSAEWYQEYPEDLWVADDHGHRYRLDRAHPDVYVANLPRYTRFKAGHPTGFIEAFANYYCDVADELARYYSGSGEPNRYVYGVDEALEGLHMLEAISVSASDHGWAPVLSTGA